MGKTFSLSGFPLLLLLGVGILVMTSVSHPLPGTPSPSPLETPAGAIESPPAPPPSPASPIAPSPSPGPTEAPSPSPAPSPTPSPSPSPSPPPPLPPSPPPTAIPSGPGQMALLRRWGPLAGIGCIAVSVVLLLALVALFARRRPKPGKGGTRPIPPVPPTPPVLESSVAGRRRRWPLEKASITVGRAPDNDLVITPEFPGWDTVSRHHARLYRRGDDWVVEDLGSTNGTFVNGRRTGRNLLRDGWELKIGGVAFTFRAGRGGAA